MGRYAEGTQVSVARSKAEIEEVAQKYGGRSFFAGVDEEQATAIVTFQMGDRRVKIVAPMPRQEAFAKEKQRYVRHHMAREKVVDVPPERQLQLWEQACRQRWRALKLLVQAKLEAIASGITSFDEAFLADMVVPTNEGVKRIAEMALPALADTYKNGTRLMLGAGSPP